MAWGASDPARPIRLMRRAVELSPENSQYREALAAYLTSSGQNDEAMTALKEVAGGRHPISQVFASETVFAHRMVEIMAGLKAEGLAVLVAESNDRHIAELLDGNFVIERGTIVSSR